MEQLYKIVDEIKSMRIQGAEEVAIAAIHAWENARDKALAERLLAKARPTEPMLRNVLLYLRKFGEAEKILKIIEDGNRRIAEYGSRKLAGKNLIYTHCHSLTVENVLKRVFKTNKRLVVNVTETRPRFQGRITAANLARAGIKVNMFVDSAALQAIRDADAMIIGADAITTYGTIINKIGSNLFAKIAFDEEVPVYVATHTLKYDPKTLLGYNERIEKRSAGEVWNTKMHNINVVNYIFEEVSSDYIAAVITEMGVVKPDVIVEMIESKYKWLA
ncbi:MAG: hypothetical protein QXE33_02660 [Candidatus Micrarchaeaceae archaeon]